MLRLIMYRVVRPTLARIMLAVEHHWPNQTDLYHPDTRLWPNDVVVPDDARELAP